MSDLDLDRFHGKFPTVCLVQLDLYRQSLGKSTCK